MRLINLRILWAAFILFSLSACSPPAAGVGDSVTIFAAASLSDAFEELAVGFESENPGLRVELVFAGSQQLATQIREGAQADVFASANGSQMDSVVEAGLAEAERVAIFTSNKLVAIVPKSNPAGMDDLQNLAQPGRRLVFAADEVPAGEYTLEFLDKADSDGELGPNYRANVLKNVVSYENDVRAVLTKVLLGEADAGIVYSSDASPDLLDRISRIEIPERWNIQAFYPIVVLKGSVKPELAEDFVQFVLSAQGRSILKEHGFQPATP